jgi:hypothetical protein
MLSDYLKATPVAEQADCHLKFHQKQSWETDTQHLLSSWSGQHRSAGERFALILPPPGS